MNKDENQINITAKTVEEFQKAIHLLNMLPKNILEQIDAARFNIMGDTLICGIRNSFKDPLVIYLPNNIQYIKNNGDYINIFTTNGKFTFSITGELLKKNINYEFVACPNIK